MCVTGTSKGRIRLLEIIGIRSVEGSKVLSTSLYNNLKQHPDKPIFISVR